MPLFLQKKNSLEHACWRFKTVKDQGVNFQEKKPWARLLDVQGFQKSRAYFSLEEHTSVEHARVQGFQKIQSRFFLANQKHCLEHAHWTFRASRKSNSAKVISYCQASKAVSTKRLSCVAQVTQGNYIDVVFRFSQKHIEFKHRGPNASFEYLWEKVEPIHPLSDKVFEQLSLWQVKSVRDKLSNRVRSY